MDETNYTDTSLYIAPVTADGENNSLLGLSTDSPIRLTSIPLAPVDIQVGPLPAVIEPNIDINLGLKGEIISGLGYDMEGGDEGFGTTILVHSDGSVTQTLQPAPTKPAATWALQTAARSPPRSA